MPSSLQSALSCLRSLSRAFERIQAKSASLHPCLLQRSGRHRSPAFCRTQTASKQDWRLLCFCLPLYYIRATVVPRRCDRQFCSASVWDFACLRESTRRSFVSYLPCSIFFAGACAPSNTSRSMARLHLRLARRGGFIILASSAVQSQS